MIRLTLALSRTLCLLLILASLGWTAETRRDFLVYYDDPNWPGNAGYTQYYHDSVNAAQRALIAERYELGIGQTCEAADAVRALNPDFGWFLYNSFQDNYVTGSSAEHQWLMNRAAADGENPEIVYLHYYDDTRITLQGTTIEIKGWGGGTATTMAEARLPVYYSNKSRIMCNYSNATARQYYKEYMVQQFSTHPTDAYGVTSTGYYTGVFWDNCQPELYNYGSVVSGGHVLEHPTHARIDDLGQNDTDWWYTACIRPFMQELMDTLAMSEQWMPDGSKIGNMLNTAGNTRSGLYTDNVATHLFQEFAPSITRNSAAYFTSFAAHDVQCAANGVHVCYSPNSNTTVSNGSGSYTKEQVLHGNLCWFYVSSTDSSILYQQSTNTTSNFSWEDIVWCGSMDYDVGQPLGTYTTTQSGTDPSGYSYNVYKRVFERATVFVRPRGAWNEDIDEGTAVTVPLGFSGRELMPDGTIGSVITSITIRNAEGKIVVPAEGDVTPPRTIDDLLGDAGSTSGSIDLSWTAPGDDGDEGNAMYYVIKYSSDPDVTSGWTAAQTYPSPPSPSVSGTVEHFTMTSLAKGELLSVAVKAYDESGNGSEVSNVVSVYTAGIKTPAQISTEVSLEEQYARLTCSTVVSTYESLVYQFELQDSAAGTSVVSDATDFADSKWSITFIDLDPSSTYYWRCRAVALAQDSSDWSAAKKFRLNNIVPDPPILSYPSDNDTVVVSDNSFALVVNNSIDDDGPEDLTYNFELYAADASTLLASATDVSQGSPVTSWTVPIDLDDGIFCEWRVRCFDGVDYSDWSDLSRFYVASFGSGEVTTAAVRIIAYPNPVRFSQGEYVTFRLPDHPVDLLIQTISGETIQLRTGISGDWQWFGENASGNLVATGVYLWSVRNTGESGKIVVKP